MLRPLLVTALGFVLAYAPLLLLWPDLPPLVPFGVLGAGAAWGVANWWRRRKRIVVLFLPLLALIGHGVWFFVLARYETPRDIPAIGRPAPSLQAERVRDGKPFRLAQERGHAVVLIFFRGAW